MEDSHTQWKRIRSEYGEDLKLFRPRFDYMENPRNGKSERMIILESSDSVNVAATTADQQLLFVKQYRFGIERPTLELPGGIVDPGEDSLTAGKRELREETGHTGINWQALGKVGSNPVFMDSYIHHYAVENAELTDSQHLDDGELVEVVKFPIPEVKQMLLDGQFEHPHTISCLVRYFAVFHSFL